MCMMFVCACDVCLYDVCEVKERFSIFVHGPRVLHVCMHLYMYVTYWTATVTHNNINKCSDLQNLYLRCRMQAVSKRMYKDMKKSNECEAGEHM